MILDPFGEIDRIADAGISGAMLGAGIPGNHPACGNPNSNLDLRFVAQGLLLVETLEQSRSFQARPARLLHGALRAESARRRSPSSHPLTI